MEHLLKALERGDRGDALEGLLEAWRADRSVALADLVTAVGEEAARALAPIAGRARRDFQDAWIDLANLRRATDVPRLLQSLAHPPWTMFADRIDRLEQLRDDPRIALALARFVEERPVRSRLDDTTWRRVLAIIERCRDARCWPHVERTVKGSGYPSTVEADVILPVCRRLLASPPPKAAAPDRALLDALHEAVRQLANGPPATLTQLQCATPVPPRATAELLAAVYADPDDDAPRRVFADSLLALGDVRGEFIVTQLAPQQTRKQLKFERDALKRNQREWLGPLEPVVDRKLVRFERGFLATAVPRFRTAQQIAQLADDPAWSTVTQLRGSDDDLMPLLDHCALGGLRRLDTIGYIGLARLSRRERPLPRLQALSVYTDDSWSQMSPALFPAFEELSTAGWDAKPDLDWVRQGPLFARVRRLVIYDPATRLAHWAPRFSDVEELVVAAPHFGGLVRRYIVRAGELDVSGVVNANATAEILRGVAPLFKAVRLHAATPAAALETQVQQALARAGITVDVMNATARGDGRPGRPPG